MTMIVRFSAPQPGGAWWQRLTRYAMIVMGAILGAALFLITASAALVIFLLLAALAGIAFAAFWIRAKVKGQTLREAAMAKAAAHMGMDIDANARPRDGSARARKDGGPILDAQRTADGWSVEQ